MQNQQKYRVGVHWLMLVISVLATLMFIGFTFIVLRSVQTGSLPGMIFFTLLSAYSAYGIWLSRSSIEMTADDIIVNVPYGRYGIKWQEVKSIETNGQLVAFNGENKRLVISLTFASNQAKAMREFMDSQIKLRQIDVKQSIRVPRTHMNARL
jgi:hypothetical protein